MNGSDAVLELSRAAIALGLAVWVGGTLVAFLTARTLFEALPSRSQAGELFGKVIERLDKARFVAAGGLLVGVLLEVQTSGSALAARHVFRAVLLFLLVAAHVYAVMVVKPKMRYYREKVADLDAADADDPWREKFRHEHGRSEGVNALGLLLALAALVVG